MELKIKWPIDKETASENDVVILVDILRATSAITTLINRGAQWVKPVVDVDEARVIAAGEMTLLMGERDCVKLEGFDFGNSPTEILKHDVNGARVVFTSTNFPKTLAVAGKSQMILVGSMLNITAVTEYAYKYASENNRDICYVGAGYEGKPSEEDAVFAGVSAKMLGEKAEPAEDVREAIDVVGTYGMIELIKYSEHAHRLYKAGFEEDVEFASRVDQYGVVGVYCNGIIRSTADGV